MSRAPINDATLQQIGRRVAEIIYRTDPAIGGDPNFATFWQRARTEAQALVDELVADLAGGGRAARLVAKAILDEWRAEQRDQAKGCLAGTMTGQLLEELGIG